MIRILPAILGAALLQDSSTPFQWKVDFNSRFTLTFTFQRQRRHDVLQKGVGTLGTTHTFTEILDEKREIQAELSYREVPGRPWALSVDLKKVTWTYATEGAEVVLTFTEGKEPQARVSVRERDKLKITTARENAERQAEHMKRLLGGEYDLVPERNGRVVFSRAGAVEAGVSLFGRAFVQPPAPAAPPAPGLTWKEPIPSDGPGPSESGATEISYTVVSLNEKGTTVKGSVSGPLTRPSEPGTSLIGVFSLEREFLFSPEGYVPSAREEWIYRKTSLRKEQFFGGTTTTEENASDLRRQSLTLKPIRPEPVRKP